MPPAGKAHELIVRVKQGGSQAAGRIAIIDEQKFYNRGGRSLAVTE
jgi:hypothetical protein